MNKLLPIILLLVGAFLGQNWLSDEAESSSAFTKADANSQVRGSGNVIAILPDDNKGSRHQRFILRLASGQTILVAHNIDLAPRVADLREGDSVEFYGEYEWNDKGGVIHWTHRDYRGSHPHGWLRHDGSQYD